MSCVETKDRSAVGAEIANCRKLLRELLRNLNRGYEYQIVILACSVALLVDVTDFDFEHETYGASTRSRDWLLGDALQVRPKLEPTVLRRNQLLFDLCHPPWMSEVSRRYEADPLQECTAVESDEIQFLARCSREPGVNVQISREFHGWHPNAQAQGSNLRTLRRGGGDFILTRREPSSEAESLEPF